MRATLAVLLVTTWFGVGCRTTPAAEADPARTVGRRLAASMCAGDVEQAAALLWYPPELQGAALDVERRNVAGLLRHLVTEFGTCGDFHVPERAEVESILIFSADDAYWRTISEVYPTHRSIYRTRFSKLGDGYVVVGFVADSSTGFYVHSVGLGLPRSRVDVAETLRAIRARGVHLPR